MIKILNLHLQSDCHLNQLTELMLRKLDQVHLMLYFTSIKNLAFAKLPINALKEVCFKILHQHYHGKTFTTYFTLPTEAKFTSYIYYTLRLHHKNFIHRSSQTDNPPSKKSFTQPPQKEKYRRTSFRK